MTNAALHLAAPVQPRDEEASLARSPRDLDDAPIYLFRVPTLVFEPFEAIGTLAVALLALPSRVTRVRFVVEGDVSRRRRDLVRAVLAGSRVRATRDEIPFAPVVLRSNTDSDEGDRARPPLLLDVVARTFAWLGLDIHDAPLERDVAAYASTLDDEERSMRGELSVLVMRTAEASHLMFFDDGSRELLAISVPLDEQSPRTEDVPIDPELEARLAALLRPRTDDAVDAVDTCRSERS